MTRLNTFSFKTSLTGLVVFAALAFAATAAKAQSQIINVNPNHSIVAGVNALNEGRVEVAIENFERALRRNLNRNQQVVVYNNLCVAQNLLGKADAAIKACENALKMDPNYWRAALNLGNVYFDLGDWLSAHAHYTRALEMNPGEGAILANLELVARTRTASAK